MKNRLAYLAAGVLVASGTVIAYSVGSHPSDTIINTTSGQPVPAPYVYNAEVVSVHDGDTIDAIVDFGFFMYLGNSEHPIPVRILGINARELSEPGGKEARDNLVKMLPVGTKIVLKSAKPDKYAPRWDATISTKEISDLPQWLIDNQWAASYSGSGPKNIPPWPRTIK